MRIDSLIDFYRYTDSDGRRYRLGNLTSSTPNPEGVYEYKGYKPHAYGWKVTPEEMARLDAENKLHFPKTLSGRIQSKIYLEESPTT